MRWRISPADKFPETEKGIDALATSGARKRGGGDGGAGVTIGCRSIRGTKQIFYKDACGTLVRRQVRRKRRKLPSPTLKRCASTTASAPSSTP